MRLLLLSGLIVLTLTPAAYGQFLSRFEIGPVARLDAVFLEGGAQGTTATAGVFAAAAISPTFGVEAELTRSSKRIERSYEGWFISYAPLNSTREEIEHLAPIARRTLDYEPGLGVSAAFVVRTAVRRHVSLNLRAGASARHYRERATHTVLSIPAGIDPAIVARDLQRSDSSSLRGRSGLLLGAALPVVLTQHFSVTPEVRLVYGGPARIGHKYRELGVGARGAWRF